MSPMEKWGDYNGANVWISAEDDDTIMEYTIKDTSKDFENRYKNAMRHAERYIEKEIEKKEIDMREF